ncbi:hypothetical protein H6S82_29290 [Planktothrix sp. FACHB-1355]|uniref:Uncharacterized protein n=1 Tax=Aerosakkonema funiforme FACHB-1375 TaxID=2949571 RepID=A0A926VDE6_9CYAN|nr:MULTISPECIES: hypothetical protein [Oscillatoriales]MBD2181783.1 hypothetical protein [Aerosakkonema funiforme FACHB-1375]MBD3562907.1 hypothetical protein [Planktothrix sp. FACHB-1355]
MTAILLAFSATTYFFSGSVCYLAFLSHLTDNSESSELKSNYSKLSSLWISLLWPLWIVSETYAEDRKPENKTFTHKLPEYATCRHELTSTTIGEMKQAVR